MDLNNIWQKPPSLNTKSIFYIRNLIEDKTLNYKQSLFEIHTDNATNRPFLMKTIDEKIYSLS